MGGGYVYARNEHGKKTWHGVGSTDPWGKVTLLDYNLDARTYRRFEYTKKNVVADLQQIETSGNFVHNTKQIVDDCYPHGGIYKDGYEKSPAHYWFIRGSIYVYDQYISAYTGAANAYAEKVELPLTISAAANGRMTLREVQPNYYAYYDKNLNKLGDKSANADETTIKDVMIHGTSDIPGDYLSVIRTCLMAYVTNLMDQIKGPVFLELLKEPFRGALTQSVSLGLLNTETRKQDLVLDFAALPEKVDGNTCSD